MRPEMLPVVCCADADELVTTSTQTAIIATMILFITFSPPVKRNAAARLDCGDEPQ
jgi:hypothetical protein